ncbi:MAG: hypothetical protein AAF403_04720 [Pseudomonadota bacterium]
MFVLSACQTTSLNNLLGEPNSSQEKSDRERDLGLSLDEEPVVDPFVPEVFIDVMVPVFDPGLPVDTASYTEEGIWPELRRAESNRFAFKMKEALENTGDFGAVRVVPDDQASGDLFVLGTIIQSNARDVEFKLEIFDSRQKRWGVRKFSYEVEPAFHEDLRNKNKDSYQPVFDEAAQYIVTLLKRRSVDDLGELKQITKLKFASIFSQESFSQYLEKDDGQLKLVGLPANDDPMVTRVERLKAHDDACVDQLQHNYEDFNLSMNPSYYLWQKEALLEQIAAEEAENKAMLQKILGVVSVAAAVAAVVAGANTDIDTSTLAVGLGGLGIYSWSEGRNSSEQGKYHRANLQELGKTLQIEMETQNITLEDEAVELKGNAKEQYIEWRNHLRRIFVEEQTPDVILQ